MLRHLPLCALAASLTAAGCVSEPAVSGSEGETDSPNGSEGTGTATGSGTSLNTTAVTESKSGTATSATTSESADTTEGTDTELETTTGTGSGSDSSSDTEPTTPTVCPTFLDSFDDAVKDPLWRQSFPASTSEVDGELVITVTGALNDEYVTMVVLPEDGRLEGGLEGGTMRVELGAPPVDIGVRTTLWVHPTAHMGRISYNLVDRGSGLQIEARITPEVGAPQITATLEWDPDTMDWLQLRESGGVLYFETSTDGVTFELFHEMPTPFDVSSAEVGFAGHNDGELPNDVEVSVETFEFICG